MMAREIEGAALLYGGKQEELPMADRLAATMRQAVRLLGQLGFGACESVATAGTYNPDSRLPDGRPSEHAVFPPRAIDIVGVAWANGNSCRSQDRITAPSLHLRVEACLRLAGFGLVLGYDYNQDHHGHWHCDHTLAFGMGPRARSQVGFVERVLHALGWSDVRAAQAAMGCAVDGVCGPETLAALCTQVIRATAQEPATAPAVHVGARVVPYTQIGDQGTAWVPLRAYHEAVRAPGAISVERWPEIDIIS